MIKIVNVLTLSNYLMNNLDGCISILEAMDYTGISYRPSKNEIRFSREDGQNPTSMRLKVDTLKFDGFSMNLHGNIYTLIMETKNISFPKSLKWAAKVLGLEKEQLNQKIKYPFSGFYKGLMKEVKEPESTMQTYQESILDEYKEKYNLMFFHDGIDFLTQAHFKVGYDAESMRITVPEYTLNGELCGIMGRLNDTNCAKEERWLPIIPCSRSLTLYGYHENYNQIQNKNIVVIGESEKFVQQLYSMGCHVGLATCGCDISTTQAKYIKSLMTKKIILAYDEGLDESQVREQAEKLILNNAIFKNKVGYVLDRDNSILAKGSKSSPTDLGKKAFQELIKNHVTWIGENM